MVPLFPGGMPGGPELIVLLLIFGMGIVPLLVLTVGAYFFGKSRGKAEAYEEQQRQ
jgi:hypothetical protein